MICGTDIGYMMGCGCEGEDRGIWLRSKECITIAEITKALSSPRGANKVNNQGMDDRGSETSG